MAERPVLGTAELPAAEIERLTRRGLRLAQFTVAYNVVEGVVAVTVGLMAGLVSLVGFGLDSGIESAAAVLVGLRLAARLRDGEADEDKERRTLKAVAVTFYVLAAYVVIEGVRSLFGDEEPDHSVVGIVLLVASVIVMPLLARAKRRVAHQLGGDQLILADATETQICVLLSISTLAGLALYAWTGAAWLDPVAGFVIAAFAIHEGREAWEGELVEDHDEDHDEDHED
jgi:divalent metal cation (Fe/Co/Zn/Cd) transporter